MNDIIHHKGVSGCLKLIACLSATLLSTQAHSESPQNWSGHSVGISIGYLDGSFSPKTTVSDGDYFRTENIELLNNTFQDNIGDQTFVGTFSYSYTWQHDHFIYGIETNVFLQDFKKSNDSGDRNYNAPSSLTYNTNTTIENQYGISLMPKVGYVFDDFLVDFSVGPTLSKFKYSFGFSDSTTSDVDGGFSDDKWALGTSVGFNISHKMENDYVIRAGYLYTYYSDVVDGSRNLTRGSTETTDRFEYDGSFESHSISVGIVKYF